MPDPADIESALSNTGPQTLWEAFGEMSRVQEEQAFAIRQGDTPALDRLLTEQVIAWTRVREFAERLVEAGKAPPNLVERLRGVLIVHKERERELDAAKRRLQERLIAAQEAVEATDTYRQLAA
jgi:hypothetical protein